jgi:hypothetical protein
MEDLELGSEEFIFVQVGAIFYSCNVKTLTVDIFRRTDWDYELHRHTLVGTAEMKKGYVLLMILKNYFPRKRTKTNQFKVRFTIF